MKLLKSLLLGSAAGLAAVSGASAADLGAKKPSPVEYVRACYNPLWGTTGGFVIPGTQTCLRIAGQARFDYGYVQQYFRTGSPSGFRGGMFLSFDAITPSEYGNVRAFGQVGMISRTGNQISGSAGRQGTFFNGAFGSGLPAAGGTGFVYSGFIQFAGITAGNTASFFDPFFGTDIIQSTFRSSVGNVNLIAYTAALGNGLTATVSIEDPTNRRQGVVFQAPLAAANPTAAALAAAGGILGVASTNAATLNQAGIGLPHVVGALRLDQSWGSAMVAGALTNVRNAGPTFGVAGAAAVVPFLPAAAGNFASVGDTKLGFAVQGALKINLPMIAAGNNFVITGAYGQGALSYVVSNQFGATTTAQGFGGVLPQLGDAIVDPITGGLKLVNAWSVAASFQHFWSPTLSTTLFGSYAQVDVPGATPFSPLVLVRDSSYWSVGANTVWQPVRGLNIALEGSYIVADPKGRVFDLNKNNLFNGQLVANGAAAAAGGPCTVANINAGNLTQCFTKGSQGLAQVRLRITRDF